MNTERYGDWISTFRGVHFFPLDPRSEDINIEDIAHALSNQCRFSGHTRKFFSVAQHSALVSTICDPADALWGLLHDASEAYLVDLPRPLKRGPGFEAYNLAESKVMLCVCRAFGLDVHMPESVHRADGVSLITEAEQLMGPLGPEWDRWRDKHDALPYPLRPQPPEEAERIFLARFAKLTRSPAPAVVG